MASINMNFDTSTNERSNMGLGKVMDFTPYLTGKAILPLRDYLLHDIYGYDFPEELEETYPQTAENTFLAGFAKYHLWIYCGINCNFIPGEGMNEGVAGFMLDKGFNKSFEEMYDISLVNETMTIGSMFTHPIKLKTHAIVELPESDFMRLYPGSIPDYSDGYNTNFDKWTIQDMNKSLGQMLVYGESHLECTSTWNAVIYFIAAGMAVDFSGSDYEDPNMNRKHEIIADNIENNLENLAKQGWFSFNEGLYQHSFTTVFT